jgi:predicted metal-dependent HD superfamily phosphohydrolase
MVVHNARAVGAAMKLTSAQLDLLISSAWLHDVGFTVTYLGHEEEGCRMAESLLGSDMSVEDMAVIKEAIMSTEIPQNGRGLVSQVLCDADLFYLGTNLFFPWSDRLRDEHRNVLNITYTEVEWIDVNLDFIRDQHFYTDFARDYCAQGCALHLRMLEEMRAEAAL